MKYKKQLVSYRVTTYTIKAKTLKEAEEKYNKGEYEEVREGGVLDGETISEEWL